MSYYVTAEIDEDDERDEYSDTQNDEQYDRYQPSRHNKNSHPSHTKRGSQDKLDQTVSAAEKVKNNPVGKTATTVGADPAKYLKAINKTRKGDYTGAAIDASKQLTLDAAKKGVLAFFTSIPGMITLAAIIILIILLFFVFLVVIIISGDEHNKRSQDNKTLTISKTGPSNAKVNDILEYKITINASHPVSEIVVTDHYPAGTIFVSSSWKGQSINKAERTITWRASQNMQANGGSFSASNLSFTLRLRATRDNTTLINWAEANATFASTNETLTIRKSGPTKANINQTIDYTITVKETKPASDIVVIDHMPQGTNFVSSSWNKYKIDRAANTITWNAKDNVGNNGNLNDFTIRVTLRATRDNTNLINWAEATSTLAGGGPISSTYVPPTNNNCGGKYSLTGAKNFGDPQCNFTKAKLASLIKSGDPQHLHEWYDVIVKHESTYNPNAFNGNSTSGQGAYGLYQMNPRGRGIIIVMTV